MNYPQPDTASSDIAALQRRLDEAEETLRAIREGEVDALVVGGPDGDRVFSLQGAETPYRILMEDMNEGALLLVPDGTVLYANIRFAELVSKPLEEVIGASWPQFFPLPDQSRATELLQAPGSHGVKAEFQLGPSGGPTRPVQVSLASLKRAGVEGFSVVVTDLTEPRKAEEALRHSNAKLRELVTDLERFSYSISHDMRAPLRAMKSFAELLQQQCASRSPLQNPEWLQRISAAASRLDAQIQGALDYTRVVKQDMVMEPVALSNLLSDMVENYPNFLRERAEIRVEEGLPVVLGNSAALTQIFSNLLGNAVKFVPPETRPRVRVWAEQTGTDHGAKAGLAPLSSANNIFRIWVEDNGIGMPPEAKTRIFEMFQRLAKNYEGTGIGLAVVRKTVERMGGRVGVESETGKGSRFWVELHGFAPPESGLS